MDNSDQLRLKFLQHLQKNFKIEKFGKIHYLLGMKITQTENEVTISQEKYINTILERFGMSNCNGTNTPMQSTATDFITFGDPAVNQHDYMEIIGSLNYLATISRPDIAYAVSYFGRFMANPRKSHFIGAKRIIRYLKNTKDYQLTYSKSGNQKLIGYSDASFGGDSANRKSHGAYIFTLAGASIGWKSKLQRRIAKSSTEAELLAASDTVSEAKYIAKILEDLHFDSNICVTLYQDNQPAIAIQTGTAGIKRCKHADIDFHYIREAIEFKEIEIKHIPSNDMLADPLTKPPNGPMLKRLKPLLFGC
jgi:hypothetical protein